MHKNITLMLAIGLVAGFVVTVASGLYEQTVFPIDLWSGVTKTWGGLPFGWWGYSQSGHVYGFNPPHWLSYSFFLLDVVFWFVIAVAVTFSIFRLASMKSKS